MERTARNLVSRRSRSLSVCLAAVLMVVPGVSHSQIAGTSSIQGTVTDKSGAALPNATVVVTNTATLVKHTTTTDAAGLYSFPNIPIGSNTLDVSATGFEHYKQSNIVLEVGSSIAVNVVMTLGSGS